MISALAAAVLCAFTPPKAGLTVGDAVKVSPEKIESTVQLIATELLADELPTRRVESKCAGDPPCLAAAAQREQVWALAVLTLAMAKGEILIDLEVWKVDGWVSLGHATFPLKKGKLDEGEAKSLADLARQTLAAAPKPPPEVKEEAKTAEVAPPPPGAVETAPPPPAPSRLAPTLLMVAGGLAAGAGVGFGIWGQAEKQRLGSSPDGINSVLTRPEAIALRDSANTHFTVSLATGIAAGVLLAAGILWLLLE